MTYALAAPLQSALYAALSTALPGLAIFDAPPAGGGSGTFLLIGPEEVVDQSDKSGAGAEHRVTLSLVSDKAGFLEAKTLAATLCDALASASLTLPRGRVVSLQFQRAAAQRLRAGRARRIDLRFRVRVEDDL